ncbi:hypothetical protein OHB49_45075 (plasmid) [Streptomyces sp. NBC_01717]|nr:hypothetical protein [Streptomyces sp. NBC_01717]
MGVYQVRSSQSPFVQREQISRRCCPGCEATRPEQWNEVIRTLYGDD